MKRCCGVGIPSLSCTKFFNILKVGFSSSANSYNLTLPVSDFTLISIYSSKLTKNIYFIHLIIVLMW